MTGLYRNGLRILPNRWFHLSAIRSEQKAEQKLEQKPEQKPEPNESREDFYDPLYLDSVPLRKVDKRLLVWSGKYKKIEDVPDRLSRATIARAHSVCRVKMCNYMIVGTIIAAICYIISGKRDAARGLSRTEIGRRRNEEFMKKLEMERQARGN